MHQNLYAMFFLPSSFIFLVSIAITMLDLAAPTNCGYWWSNCYNSIS